MFFMVHRVKVYTNEMRMVVFNLWNNIDFLNRFVKDNMYSNFVCKHISEFVDPKFHTKGTCFSSKVNINRVAFFDFSNIWQVEIWAVFEVKTFTETLWYFFPDGSAVGARHTSSQTFEVILWDNYKKKHDWCTSWTHGQIGESFTYCIL